jgi:hypothetical protein
MNNRLAKPIIVLIALVLMATPASAAGGSSFTAQAFGVFVASVSGAQANIWTAQQPAGWYGISSPVGVCTTQPTCSGNFFETGYMKGTVTTVQNVLQQYISYRTNLGIPVNLWGYGNLSDLTWYNFKVQNCGVAPQGKWCAYRNGSQVGIISGLSFESGLLAACGGEGGGGGVPMGVECNNLMWRDLPPNGSNWWNYDYSGTQGWSKVPPYLYCVMKPYSYGSKSWRCV